MIQNCSQDIYEDSRHNQFIDYGNGGYDCRIVKVWQKLQTKMDKLS